jgi:4-hydroxy-3-polyprenylbenzoate decarboxylase
VGPDPILFLASSGVFGGQWGVSEYEIAGYVNGAPIDVVIDEYTGLPIPAESEMVLAGEIPPPQEEMRPEGPFGEYTGYYAHGKLPEPVVRVKAVYHRSDPILLGSPALLRKGSLNSNFALTLKKRDLKRKLLAAGIPDVVDDCTLQDPGVEVIKIKQRYPGHAAEAGMAAAVLSGAKIIIVVDDDIDIRDPWQVLWAAATRCDPETTVEIVRGCSSTTLDPRMPPEKKRVGDLTTSKLMINACRPYHWAKDFPAVNRCGKELRMKTLGKWSHLFRGREVKA